MPEIVDEIPLKDMALKIKSWLSYLKSRWKVVLLTGIIGALLLFFYAYKKKPIYTGSLTFVLSNGTKPSGLAGLAGQLGLDLSGNSNSDAFDGENIVELLQTRNIVKGALFKTIPENSELLVNHFGNFTGIFRAWKQNDRVKSLIPFPDSAANLNPVQDSLVSVIHKLILKNYLEVGKADKKLSFYTVTTTSTNEIISAYLTKGLVAEASKMYINTKTKIAQDNLNMLKNEADSIRKLLGNSLSAIASTTDQTFNLNQALQSQRTDIQRSQVQAEVLGTAYGEVIKNMEIAKITLQKETPLFQVIDEPRLPLVKEEAGKLKYSILGFFVFSFLCSGFILFKAMMEDLFKRELND